MSRVNRILMVLLFIFILIIGFLLFYYYSLRGKIFTSVPQDPQISIASEFDNYSAGFSDELYLRQELEKMNFWSSRIYIFGSNPVYKVESLRLVVTPNFQPYDRVVNKVGDKEETAYSIGVSYDPKTLRATLFLYVNPILFNRLPLFSIEKSLSFIAVKALYSMRYGMGETALSRARLYRPFISLVKKMKREYTYYLLFPIIYYLFFLLFFFSSFSFRPNLCGGYLARF